MVNQRDNFISISTDRRGLIKGATEHSVELIKKFYYALKRKNQFYRFQKSFSPLRGLGIQDVAFIHGIVPHSVEIGDIDYYPVPVGKIEAKKTKIPNVLIDFLIIYYMLNPTAPKFKMDYDEWVFGDVKDVYPMSKREALGHYAEFYFSELMKNKKPKPVKLMVEFMFGIFGLLLFTTAFFFVLSAFLSKTIALGLLLVVFMLTLFAIIVLSY